MVNYSQTDSAADNCLSSTKMGKEDYHYKTFVSESQFMMVLKTLQRLRDSDIYWFNITGSEANVHLSDQVPGTYLLRESSDSQHLFTLSIKTKTGTKNLRIVCDENSFFFQTDPENVDKAPRFDCVLKLLSFYSQQRRPNVVFYISTGGGRLPLELVKPLHYSFLSLQHLCRRKINKDMDVSIDDLNLPRAIKEYLKKNKYTL